MRLFKHASIYLRWRWSIYRLERGAEEFCTHIVHTMIEPNTLWRLYTLCAHDVQQHLRGELSYTEKELWLRFRVMEACLTRLSEIAQLLSDEERAAHIVEQISRCTYTGNRELDTLKSLAKQSGKGYRPYLGIYEWRL